MKLEITGSQSLAGSDVTKKKFQQLIFIFQILGLTRKLEHQYLGVSSVDHALIQQTRLKACTLQILTKMKSDPTRCSQAKETYLQQLQALKKSVDRQQQ